MPFSALLLSPSPGAAPVLARLRDPGVRANERTHVFVYETLVPRSDTLRYSGTSLIRK